jgi:hypothetical protein
LSSDRFVVVVDDDGRWMFTSGFRIKPVREQRCGDWIDPADW